jgi:hypothetical protein
MINIIEKYIKTNNIQNVINKYGIRPFKIIMNEDNMKDLFISDNDISKFLIKISETLKIKSGDAIYISVVDLLSKNEFNEDNKKILKKECKTDDDFINFIITMIVSDYNKYYLDDKYYYAFWYDGVPYTDETKKTVVKDEPNIIKIIKDIINSESLKNKYEDVNKDIFIIIDKIIDQNPDFFILIEEILLELVKDNKINITIFNYSFIFDKLGKLFKIFNEIKLDEFNNLLSLSNFVDLLKFVILVSYDSNKENIPKYDEFIKKMNETIKSISDALNLFINV